jgi:hypothetical protein
MPLSRGGATNVQLKEGCLACSNQYEVELSWSK